MTEPKLTIELVPRTAWGSNLRGKLPVGWPRISAAVREAAGGRCEICGRRSAKLEAHEVWDYGERGIQRLAGILALCRKCHEVKHFGLACVRERAAEASAHLAAVNGWSAREAEDYVDEAFAVWRERSEIEWELDLSWAAENFPADWMGSAP